MSITATMTMDNEEYVVIPQREYECEIAQAAKTALPPYPKANRNGDVPALEYARASIAREIIVRRLASGLTQEQLAKQSGVRVETISRLESAKHKPQAATVEKIDNALKELES